MGVTDVLSRKSGVITGDDVLKLFTKAKELKFAIPAIVSSRAALRSPASC
jgi:fructose-bisphosphate aldolase class II